MNPTILLTPLVLISIVIFIAWPLLKDNKSGSFEKTSLLDSATQEKDSLMTSLKDLEMDFRMGKLSEEDYQTSKPDLEARALKALEHVESLERKAK